MGGLLAGNILVRRGWDVTVLERVASGMESRGAGITPQRSLLDALDEAGAKLDSDIGIKITKRVGYDLSGAEFDSFDYEQYTTSWGRLYNVLREAFPSERFLSGHNVVDVIQNDNSASVVLENGSRLSADLVIGADGIRSTVRRAIYPNIGPKYVGYVAWRGMIEERDASPELIQASFSSFSFSFPEHEEFVAYPVAGGDGSVEVGKRRFNYMWYRPVNPEVGFRDMFTGTDGVFYENGIPPALIRPELVEAAKADAQRLLPPQFAAVVQQTQGLFMQAIYDLVSENMGTGRVALIGDAAFVARPHCGAGVSKAAADALQLGNSLDANASIPEAIAEFSERRTKECMAAVNWAAKLGSYFRMDETGNPSANAPEPVTKAFIIRNTGIELSEAFQV